MCKVLVFAGTTEGRKIAEFLDEQGVPAHVCVATEYGETLLPRGRGMTVSHERLDQAGMEALMKEIQADPVIDATHPYAAQVTENIKEACANTGCSYIRLLRENCAGSEEEKENEVYVDSVEEAAEYLKHTEGNILATTGSKEIHKYTEIPEYEKRVFARVLSLPGVAAHCAELGFQGKNLICMQGPFSMELNKAMLEQFHCRYLVTKMSGSTGGYEEKLEAARQAGAISVIVGRPLKEAGISLLACRGLLCKKFSLKPARKIALVGIGMGDEKNRTEEAREAIAKAELLIGARRMTKACAAPGQAVFVEYDSRKIKEYLDAHPEYETVAILLSGDVGFYSGAKKLLEILLEEEVTVICGIASPVYFLSKIGRSWEDAVLTSAHGKQENLVSLVKHNRKVFSILGTKDGVAELARKLTDYGMGQVQLFVGERLSYEDEKILSGKAEAFIGYEGDPLSVVYLENEQAVPLPAVHGIKDEAFIRDKVPMTKEEVRCVSLAKLGLEEDSVCYDVGAGTGSVSVEMALRCIRGTVFAIEKKPLAVSLLEENKKKFAVDNLKIIEGEAPEAMEALEMPTHAFIGGSSGNMKAILQMLLEKNPNIKIVINCIALETVAETMKALKELPFTDVEVVQMNVSRAKAVGPYHLMMGENPITIFSCKGKE